MCIKRVIKNLSFIILMGVIFVFNSEKVDAIGCEYTAYFDEEIVYSRMEPTAEGNEYKIRLLVMGDRLVTDVFEVRSKVNPNLLENNPAGFDLGMYDSDGWTTPEDMGEKNKDRIFDYKNSETAKSEIANSIKNGVCPPLKMYFGSSNHYIKLFQTEEACDADRWGKCPRENFSETKAEEVYEKDELPNCSGDAVENFENDVYNKVELPITNAAADSMNQIQSIDPNWSYVAIDEKIQSISRAFETEATNRIAKIEEIASSYNCIEVYNLVGTLETRITNLINDNYTMMTNTAIQKYDDAKKLCDDADCVEDLEIAKNSSLGAFENSRNEVLDNADKVYEQISGAFFEPIASDDCRVVLEDVLDIVQQAFDVIKIAAPILLIFFGTMDFAKAVISGDDKATKKATTDFMKRTGAAVAIFFLPFFIELLFSLPGLESLDIKNILCGVSKVVFKL